MYSMYSTLLHIVDDVQCQITNGQCLGLPEWPGPHYVQPLLQVPGEMLSFKAGIILWVNLGFLFTNFPGGTGQGCHY